MTSSSIGRVVVLLALSAMVPGTVARAQSTDQGDEQAAPANDVFRHSSTRVGSSDTSTAGTDLFRRESVRRESVGRGQQADSVVIDGARMVTDTARANALVSQDDITEHLARPRSAAPLLAAPAPVPAPVVAAAPVAPASTPKPAPVTPAPAPVAPVVVPAKPASVVATVSAPSTPTPAPVVAMAPVTPRARTTPRLGPSTPTVKAPPPVDSAQLVREVAELQKDVAPKLQHVGTQVDSVRHAYESQLDQLARETPLPDTMQQRMMQAMINAARFKNDTATATAASNSKKIKKSKTPASNN